MSIDTSMSNEEEKNYQEFHVPRLHESDEDSDNELQAAFDVGILQPGMFRSITAPKPSINNESGLLEKLEEIKQKKFDWIERLDVTVPVKRSEEFEETGEEREFDVHNDFQREISFYEQAKDSVAIAIKRLNQAGIKTARPEDYFAEMAKKDDHMKRVREKLLNLKRRRETIEKNKMQLKFKKYGKQVHQAVLRDRQKKKKEILNAVKKYQTGKSKSLDFLDDDKGPKKKLSQLQQLQQTSKAQKTARKGNKRRQYKNTRYGFGGKKRGTKGNNKASFDNIDGKYKKGRPVKTKRLGKSRRAQVKAKTGKS